MQGELLDKAGSRVRILRKYLGLTQAEFGQKLNRSWKTVNRWEAGEWEVPISLLKQIAQTFNVSLKWLLTGEGEMFEKGEEAVWQEFGKFVRIPVVGRVGAGFPEVYRDFEVIEHVFISKETFQKGGKFAVQVNKDSMEPTLKDKDYVVFKTYTGDALDIPSGKVVVVRNHYGELALKRLSRINGILLLTSDNPKYPPIKYEQAQAEDLQIVGVGVSILLREIEL